MLSASYKQTLPLPLKLAIGAVCLLSAPPLVFYVVSFFAGPKQLSELGAQGDFFGGHVAAITSSLTLLIVLVTGYLQQTSDRIFRLREHFLAGLNVIGQYDVVNPGCEQALRMLDHYSALALELEDDELLLLLNTVMTKDIRSRLEFLENEKQPDIYVYARTAKKRLAEVLKKRHMARKGLI
ncbi:MAG: hypothetical protein RLZZ153_1255 [Pseudomonadota bacterium]|jgi:hypothetical protein